MSSAVDLSDSWSYKRADIHVLFPAETPKKCKPLELCVSGYLVISLALKEASTPVFFRRDFKVCHSTSSSVMRLGSIQKCLRYDFRLKGIQ